MHRDIKIIQVLDIETMQFEAGMTMRDARSACAVTTLDAERVFVIGGGVNGAASASTEVLSVTEEQ